MFPVVAACGRDIGCNTVGGKEAVDLRLREAGRGDGIGSKTLAAPLAYSATLGYEFRRIMRHYSFSLALLPNFFLAPQVLALLVGREFRASIAARPSFAGA